MSQKARYLQAALLIATWMALGWLLRLDIYAYLLLGIPLCLLFQLFVRKMPLSSLWVRDATVIRLDRLGIAIAVALSIAPLWFLVQQWPGGNWSLRLYLVASLVGAVGAAYALRRFTVKEVRPLLLCLATAGVFGCALSLLRHHTLGLTIGRAGLATVQFLVLVPVCFVMEEVAFRGMLDSHIHHSQDSRPWLSAILLSAVWGWWHLPITPASDISTGLIGFPITHTLIGVPLSLFWRRSGNLIVPVTVHALIDAVRNAYP